jgi:uncharacterized protein YjgD (DUF1641 family)
MARGGCATCFTGGANTSNLLSILAGLGIFLIVLGLIIYNKDILDVSINAVTKNEMNDYIGYMLIIMGTGLLFVVGVTQAQTSQ